MAKHTTELEKKYNEICGATFSNIFTTTKYWKTIPIRNLDLKNPEHLFVLHVAMNLGGVIEKQVAINASKLTIWRLNKKLHIKDKGARIISITNEDSEETTINPTELLNFMRPTAEKMCGEGFSFGDIYHEFYELKKGKKK